MTLITRPGIQMAPDSHVNCGMLVGVLVGLFKLVLRIILNTFNIRMSFHWSQSMHWIESSSKKLQTSVKMEKINILLGILASVAGFL